MRATQAQLVLPLLEALEEMGGLGKTADLYSQVADKAGVDEKTQAVKVVLGENREYNAWERSVRWAQQRAKLDGLIEPADKPCWRITGKGKDALRSALPGLVITIFTTSKGVALWGHCEDAIGHLDDGSVNLLFSSPPYALCREKSYGNRAQSEYLDWFLRIAETWPRKIARDGSIVLNFGDAWTKGEPTLSLYQERLLVKLEDELGMRLAQRFAWQNPSKLPSPAEWVTVRRVRVKPSLEQLYWLVPNDMPKADNRKVLSAYSDAMLKRLAEGGEKAALRPSGHEMVAGAFAANNGGSIPGNLLVAANTDSGSDYLRQCRAAGLPIHPARFPEALPAFFIKMLTDVGDLVYDPFGGSGTTAKVAEDLDRRWVTSEVIREYIQGQALRFSMQV